MVINAFVKFHIPAGIVTTKWIHAYRIAATMGQNAHQAQTIKISHVVARLDTLDACVIKISTNVHCLHLVAMELLAKIFPVHINVYVLTVTKEEIVPLIQMIVPHSLAQTVALA